MVVVCFLLGLVILLAVALLPPKKCSCDGAVGSGSGTNGSVVRQPGQINQTTPVEWRECLILAKTQTDCKFNMTSPFKLSAFSYLLDSSYSRIALFSNIVLVRGVEGYH